MDLNGLPQTVQNFINDTIQYRESGNCLDYDTCQKILEYAADTGSQKLTGLGLYYLAECYWQKGEYENTMQCLTESVGCLENARMYELLAKAHNMMGAVSDRKNNRMFSVSSGESASAFHRSLQPTALSEEFPPPLCPACSLCKSIPVPK